MIFDDTSLARRCRPGAIHPINCRRPDHAGERRLFPRPAIPGCENGHAPIDDRLTLQSRRDCKGVGTAISRQKATFGSMTAQGQYAPLLETIPFEN